ncbi:hypothetical protein B1M_31927 [Burkholderia sp. TJI49]|nr:hypothetical protein B1M_31927 [Burkholderia sp. TJI49]
MHIDVPADVGGIGFGHASDTAPGRTTSGGDGRA